MKIWKLESNHNSRWSMVDWAVSWSEINELLAKYMQIDSSVEYRIV